MQDLDYESINVAGKPQKRTIAIVTVFLLVVILAVATALLVRFTVFATFTVDGISMWSTLNGGDGANPEPYGDDTPAAEIKRIQGNGDVLYLNKLSKNKITRGDIVVFTPLEWKMNKNNTQKKSLVKRVIGIGGDRIQIIDGHTYLNGELLDESAYINEPMNHDYDGLDITVPSGHLFCMGDNRNHSGDSRESGNGTVPLSDVIGKCVLVKCTNGKLYSAKKHSHTN